MKRFVKFLLVFYILIGLINYESSYSIDILSMEANLLKEQLKLIGIEDKYSKNIVNYLRNLKLSKEELNKVIESGEELRTLVGDKNSITDFKADEIYNVYKKASTIANQMNLNLSYNLFEKSLSIKDKSNNKLIMEADNNEIESYIVNAKSSVSQENIDKITNIIKGDRSGEEGKQYFLNSIEVEYKDNENSKESSASDETIKQASQNDVKTSGKTSNESKKVDEIKGKDSTVNIEDEGKSSEENVLAGIIILSMAAAIATFILIIYKSR
ncbi:hypothetical protein ACQPU1_05480 [Clostridium paraputrificum]|uniref:hypothetical protein n=1 Tax=Clostridium paraputrificum TaxID=29363 RepID=UPI003D358D9E